MPSVADSGAQRAQPRMLAPGYYSQECNAHKRCDAGNPIIICARFTQNHCTFFCLFVCFLRGPNYSLCLALTVTW